MADSWGFGIQDASFGGAPLFIRRVDDDHSRSLARHAYPHEDGANIEDMGAVPRETSVELVFKDRAIQKYQSFRGLVDGTPRRFVHPLFGTYKARVEGLRPSARAENGDWIVAACTFVEFLVRKPIFDVGSIAGTSVHVSAAAVSLDDAVSDLGLPPITVGKNAVAFAKKWTDPKSALSTRELTNQINELSNSIDDAALDLEVASDINKYPLMVSLQKLNYNSRQLCDRVIAEAPKLQNHTVARAAPLLSIAQNIYGGEEAADRLESLLRLNDLTTPGLVPAGTILKVEVP